MSEYGHYTMYDLRTLFQTREDVGKMLISSIKRVPLEWVAFFLHGSFCSYKDFFRRLVNLVFGQIFLEKFVSTRYFIKWGSFIS